MSLALELAFRGYLFLRLIAAIGPFAATVVLSFVYALLSTFRPNFTSLDVYKRQESLCKAGALDAFGNRSQVMTALDKAMERAQKSQKDAAAGQHGLFGMFDEGPAATSSDDLALPSAPEWDEHTRLQNEKEVLGFFVSGHPLDRRCV